MKLGENLQSHCENNGMSLAKLARAAGIPKSTLHDWTRGRKTLDLVQLKKVCDVLRVPLHVLAFGESDPHDIPSEEILRELFTGDVRVTIHRIERRRDKK